MRLSIYYLTLLVTTQLHAKDANGFAPYETVLNESKAARKDFAIYFEGPSWLPDNAAVVKALTSLHTRTQFNTLPDLAIIPAQPPPLAEGQTPPPNPNVIPFNLPALTLVDPDGLTYAVAEGLTAENFIPSLQKLLTPIANRLNRDQLFEKARAASGVERAKLFGQGLDLIEFRFSASRADIIAEIKTADPADTTGYAFKYTFSPGAYHHTHTWPLLGQKKPNDLIAIADKHLANPTLLPTQRQIIMSGKMQAYRSLEDIPNAVKTLQEIIAVDPNTALGKGADGYIKILSQPVRLTGLKWEILDNRPTWLPMVVDVTNNITQSGTYRIEFKNLQGHTRFRKVALKVGNKFLAEVPNVEEKLVVTLVVPDDSIGHKLEIWAESQGTGWFEGRGDIVITKEP